MGLTPKQIIESEQRRFVEEFKHNRAVFPTMSNFAIINSMLQDKHWKDFADIGTYQGARKVLNKYIPEWNK